MKKFSVFLCAMMLVLGLAVSSSATSIFYQAKNVFGRGEILYGTDGNIDFAPQFSFVGTSGTVTENLASFTPGEYSIVFSIEGLEVDANEDGSWFTIVDDFSFSTGPINIPSAPPLGGTYGPLSWNVDLYSGFFVSYDFDFNSGPNSNESVNQMLSYVDWSYSGSANGIMDANVHWDNLRVELNSTAPVPEPATILLMGAGLLGLVGYSRKRFSKKS